MFLPVADTMVIDLSRQEIYLTWRLTIPDFFGMKEGVLSCIIPECIAVSYTHLYPGHIRVHELAQQELGFIPQ